MSKIYDVCIIGAGVNGSAAAFSLANKKKDVLLLEQFPVPHTRGSSHGQSRITRCSSENKIYAHMAYDSFPIWRDLELKVGEKLLIQNGMLDIFDIPSSGVMKHNISALNSVKRQYEVLTGEEINKRFHLFNVPHNFLGLYEPDGGMLLASKCVASLQKVFVQNGGTFNDSETVTKILPGDTITIETSKTEYKANSVIIAAGAYTSKLTASLGLHLPLRIERTHALYWQLDDPVSGTTASNFPSFITHTQPHIYGLAPYEYPRNIKICYHAGSPVDPERPDTVSPLLSDVKKFISGYMTGVACDAPNVIEPCLYTVTPDHHFILDTHPKYKNIVIAAGFSGSGFKMSPVTGNILADLAMGRSSSYDLSRFRMDRFNDVAKKSKL